jgi:hypothetical protein
MPTIVNEKTQEELEFQILAILNQIGLEFSVHDTIPIAVHLNLLELRKKFVSYVDNSRLLKTQVKVNESL